MKNLNLKSFIASLIICFSLMVIASAHNKTHSYFKIVMQSDTAKIRMTAKDSSVVDAKTHLTKLYGGVTLSYKSTKITADYIELNEDTRMGVARGNVVIYTNDKITFKDPVASFFKLEYPPK